MKDERRLLIIFVRNPIPGQVKTRLASVIGDKAALEIYLQLLEHVFTITRDLPMTREVHYADSLPKKDQWDGYTRKLQIGTDLGERMSNAFRNAFKAGFEQVVLIGSDLPQLQQKDILEAFNALRTGDYVIGPALDGGYYLIGMKSLNSNIFKHKVWGSSSVLAETLHDINPKELTLLQEQRDLDTYDDLKTFPEFQQYTNKYYD